MRYPIPMTRALLLAFILLGSSSLSIAQTPPSQPDLATWRAKRAADISAPDGWLSLVALGWLKDGDNSIGSAEDNSIRIANNPPARVPDHLCVLTVAAGHITLHSPASGFPAGFFLDSQPPAEAILRPDDEPHPSVLATENLRLVLLHRGDRYALRVKDADSPARTAFRGLHWYAPDPRFHVTAKWIPFTPPHTEQVPTAIGTTLALTAPGLAEVTLDGKTVQLEPVLEGDDHKQLFFILRDATSRTTTYEASRFLYTGLPSNGIDQPGTLDIDFNRLENPPSAFPPDATCPLPPYINRLPISIPAGEQRYNR